MRSRARRTLRSARGSSQIAEFAPALYIMFLIILIPLLDVVSVFVAGATLYLATNDFAAKAATQIDYSSALSSMANEATQFQSNGLARFVNMMPDGGYVGCGDDLYLLSTDIASGAVTSSMANQPLNQPIDTKANMYEISVQSTYMVSPLVTMAAMPVLQDVPGLGKPAVLTFVANRPVEHPGGLQPAGIGGGIVGGGSVNPFNRVASNPNVPALPTNATWRNPGVFKEIQALGQTVVTLNVVMVPAATTGSPLNPWVNTGLIVQPGQMVWIDTQAQGTWNGLDANGNPNPPFGPIDGLLPNMSLIGWAGANPPQFPFAGWNWLKPKKTLIDAQGAPNFIPSGNSLLNYPVTIPGPISLAVNDDTLGDTGYQVVRIIVTQ